jgi:hypothetical protein
MYFLQLLPGLYPMMLRQLGELLSDCRKSCKSLGFDPAVGRRHFASGVVVVEDFCSIGETEDQGRLKVMTVEVVCLQQR